MATLKEISTRLGISIDDRSCDIPIDEITCKSSESHCGAIFVAIKGENADGHNFIPDAYRRGARVFITDRRVSLPDDAVQLVVDDARAAMAIASAAVYGDPQKKLKIIGVTGTKGKSTVVHMIKKILDLSGRKCVAISTVGMYLGDEFLPTENSTPESCVIMKFLRRAVDEGAAYAVIEVSSQGVKQKRVSALDFDIGVITNVSRDHIGKGEHKSFSEYKECKKSFISRAKTKILNSDDKFFPEFESGESVVTYGLDSTADMTAENVKTVRRSATFCSEFDFIAGGIKTKMTIGIPGRFAVYDALAAIVACSSLGVSPQTCRDALSDFTMPGRFEKIDVGRDIDVVIDYAHNGESMKNALLSARELARGKVICVFGSVGGRTKMRRAALGKVAGKLADVCIVTSDNPNFENPLDICKDIVINIKGAEYKVIPDRENALKYALDVAEDGDFILISGKGHEKYQLVRGKKLPFDEREILSSLSKIKTKI
ncbi:MAG: UDP-N-acetylmuramoyl-L-alanyl-D-glutamate--2,6-diaminopimelate ligase [Clostridia bacterium]|nr:UDP-N-acetylmuramoyl-L-alanyl-D-glutamate--2,6-diaminopimelate ligase [Clostridia bacterium]